LGDSFGGEFRERAIQRGHRRLDEVPEEEVSDLASVDDIYTGNRNCRDGHESLGHVSALERAVEPTKRDVSLDADVRRSKRAVNVAAGDQSRDRSTVDLDDGVVTTKTDVLGGASRENLQHAQCRVG